MEEINVENDTPEIQVKKSSASASCMSHSEINEETKNNNYFDTLTCTKINESSECESINFNIEKLLKKMHIETQNKLDQILLHIQEELSLEKSKRLVAEKKLSSIEQIIEKFVTNNQ